MVNAISIAATFVRLGHAVSVGRNLWRAANGRSHVHRGYIHHIANEPVGNPQTIVNWDLLGKRVSASLDTIREEVHELTR
jgi:hypothetical protein